MSEHKDAGNAAAADLVTTLIAQLDEMGLARVGVSWFDAVNRLASKDPVAAARLASAMWCHLQRHRPESPAPLDSGFEPTEIERDPRKGTAS